ncbi:MAG: hypothetical protein ACYC8T_14615 [Myxococcaceae bacterium]
MSVGTLRSLAQLFVRDDGSLSEEEARSLVEAAKDRPGVSADERRELATMALDAKRTGRGAKDVIEKFLATPTPWPGALPLRALPGGDPTSLDDDRVALGPDGSMRGSSGVVPYSRGYAAVKNGPLRERHGSLAPDSEVLSSRERSRVRNQPPGAALDLAARAHGVRLGEGFERMAKSKAFSDPAAEPWWGKCHAWAWSALSNEVSARVDVGGPEGERGLWIAGQWLSRADLGNWMMGVADSISIGDGNQLFDARVTAEDLLKGVSQYLIEGGGGVVVDIHNDRAHGGKREVWNQPFVGADVDTRTLSGEGAQAVLRLARADGRAGSAVKHVHVVGRYGNERGDGHEGPWDSESRSWNLYAVTDAAGTVVAAYTADDPRLAGARGLPTRKSQELPEYFWKPTLKAIDDALEGRANSVIDRDVHGPEYRFFVGTVLGRGVPGATRARFEAEVAKLPPGRVAQAKRAALLGEFKGVAEAYSIEQWARAFGARGLDAREFGGSAVR